MYVTCLEQQSFCHALRKNLKFKLLYFQNKECYPAENKQADGNLYFLLCDEDKNPKLCLVMNFSFLWRHVKTKNCKPQHTKALSHTNLLLWFQHLAESMLETLNVGPVSYWKFRETLTGPWSGEGGLWIRFFITIITRGHFWVPLNLIVKARLTAKFLLWKLVFIYIQANWFSYEKLCT